MNIQEHLEALRDIEDRNEEFLHVTAYENQLSSVAAGFLNTKLSERYYFGGGEDGIVNWDPFTCLGLKGVEDLVNDAEDAAARMMSGKVVNLRCLSGVHAMMCTILAATAVGDTVMIVHHDDGGHFATQPILEKTGRKAVYATYDTPKLCFNVEETAKTYREAKCTAIYLDISYCTTKVNVKELREALGAEAMVIYDASHTIGLMMGGAYQSPLAEGADIVCANTHKTLPGPHKGMIVFKDKELGERLNGVINNGLFSTSHTHHLVALSITILEMEKYGEEYARQIIRNSNALGAALDSLGYEVRKTASNEYSETHQVHLILPTNQSTGDLYKRFVKNNISTNFDDRLGGRLFARLGTQELTRRGMQEDDMKTVAVIIGDALSGADVRGRVRAINEAFQTIHYGFEK